ncbi:putative esterase of the alpha-beta hydrolase superfamily [Candidatus Moduliflexus flocculans]|uniref:Putative esterase of the alpha-beta hydrolase superfamily n=1 Tax=Candidatus Moduliflexus flocculans TaxID=1499966 RepID=A0A081BMG3_9BACT|nr:putative esterase of the alpha-beta hydrolase superfamily [Candidatus Moduliflexus flocculans]
MSVVFTIYSAERQLGKTLLGINLGVSLLNETQKSVILVEVNDPAEGIPAWKMLKCSSANAIGTEPFSAEMFEQYIQHHSSQLSLLSLDANIFQQPELAQNVLDILLVLLRERYEFILFDISAYFPFITDELIDATAIFLVMVSSFDYEIPISIIGHRNYRVIISGGEQAIKESKHVAYGKEYVLPHDALTIEAFRQSAVPYVIQLPYRQLSQTVSRLARDIGEKRFGMALTGGAALGLSQVGILEVLERNRIAFDMMTGASFGALIGGAYAAGIELERIKQHIITWAQSCRPISNYSIHRFFRKEFFLDSGLQMLCATLLGNTYFDDLRIPLHVVAIDTRTGTSVVFKEGRVADAVKASMLIPGLFVPFKQSERHLIDGSVIYPTPVYPLKQMGANITIAVMVTPTPAESQAYVRQKVSSRQTSDQKARYQNYALVAATFDSLMERLIDSPAAPELAQRVAPDVFILPDMMGISWRDFHRAPVLIERGARATEAAIPQIEKLRWG